MRSSLIILLCTLLFFFQAGGFNYYSIHLNTPPDTIPPPPNGSPNSLSGPSSACVGDTSAYYIDVPVSCSCQWYVNDSVQPGSSSPFIITWSQSGMQEVSVVFLCSNGQMSDPETMSVAVFYEPYVFLGNDTTIIQGQTLILDAGNPGSDYLWSTGATTQILPVSLAGTYAVTVSNYCGTDSDTIEVTVFVGINDYISISGCSRLTTDHRRIFFLDMPAGVYQIQVSNLAGMVCYEGPPLSEIHVACQGIYFVRVISPETVCNKKVFVP